MTNVFAAFAAVMGDVQAVRKSDRNQQQGFQFRGIDAVMNAVGPALRAHGVIVVPEHVDNVHTTWDRGSGKSPMNASTVTVSYRVYGPDGDSFAGAASGEAFDAGDKATPKAMSVAYRTFLLQALCLPTDEPDPDHATYTDTPTSRRNNDAGPGVITPQQFGGLSAEWVKRGWAKDQLLPWLSDALHRPITRGGELTRADLDYALSNLPTADKEAVA